MGWDLCESIKTLDDAINDCIRDSEESKTLRAYYCGVTLSGELWCEKEFTRDSKKECVVLCYNSSWQLSEESYHNVRYLFSEMFFCRTTRIHRYIFARL